MKCAKPKYAGNNYPRLLRFAALDGGAPAPPQEAPLADAQKATLTAAQPLPARTLVASACTA